VRELKAEIREADPAFVAMKLGEGDSGAALYAHLRAVPRINEFRRGAIRRAESLYATRLAASASESELSGLGLLVLQRSILAIEDLGGLLHAFTDPPSWKALVSYNLDSISGTFDALFAGGDAAIGRAYLFPTNEAIRDEPDLTDEQRQAIGLLRDAALRQAREKLARVAEVWQMLHRHAKKTMHGLGFLAGTTVIEDPGAGKIDELVEPGIDRPFVVALDTTFNDQTRHVHTEVQSIVVNQANVTSFLDAGLAACDASDIFAAGRLHGLQTNHAFTIPKASIDDLPADAAEALRDLFGDEDA
jgi:hypothetical protein